MHIAILPTWQWQVKHHQGGWMDGHYSLSLLRGRAIVYSLSLFSPPGADGHSSWRYQWHASDDRLTGYRIGLSPVYRAHGLATIGVSHFRPKVSLALKRSLSLSLLATIDNCWRLYTRHTTLCGAPRPCLNIIDTTELPTHSSLFSADWPAKRRVNAWQRAFLQSPSRRGSLTTDHLFAHFQCAHSFQHFFVIPIYVYTRFYLPFTLFSVLHFFIVQEKYRFSKMKEVSCSVWTNYYLITWD